MAVRRHVTKKLILNYQRIFVKIYVVHTRVAVEILMWGKPPARLEVSNRIEFEYKYEYSIESSLITWHLHRLKAIRLGNRQLERQSAQSSKTF